jgi:iron complex outermembrane receptor protein
MMINSRATLVCGSAIGLVLAFGVATAALAQPAAPESADKTAAQDKDSAVSELVIVGSRIRRDAFNTASPVQVINREESTLAGLATTTEILQNSAVTGGSNQINNAFGGFITNGGPGDNTLGLRGLGASRTLILLNGRRIAPSGVRGALGAADLNVLPNAITDRIEILKDGASSIYGSDAVAGVVNIITKRGIDGWTLEGQGTIPTEGAGESYRASIVGGWTRGKLDISGSLEYYHRNDLTLGDRDFALCARDYQFNKATGVSTDFIDPATGQIKCYPASTGGATINTIQTSNVTAVAAPGAIGTVFNRLRPNAAVTTGLVGYEGVGGGLTTSLGVRTGFEPRMLNRSLISPATTYNGFLQGSMDTDAFGGAELYFELLGSRRLSQQTGYRQLSLDYPKGSPLIPANLQFSTAFASPLAGGITGTLPVGVRAFVGFGNDHSSQAVNFNKNTFGMKGDLFIPNWKYDAALTFTDSIGYNRQQSFLIDKLTNSMNVVAAPAGFNAALVNSGFTCAINLIDPRENCVPAPPLTAAVVGGALPQPFVDYMFRQIQGKTSFMEDVATLNIDGPLFKLPAGEVKAALGAEFRKNAINDTPDINSRLSNLYGLTSSVVTKGRDNVYELYGEVEVPVFKDMFLAKTLTLNASGRYTNYDSYGAGKTYKVGIDYVPVDWLSFRGTYGTSFRAPALFEQYLGATTGFIAQTSDPCNNYGNFPGTPKFTNCASENLPNGGNFSAIASITSVTAGGAAAGLSAETSKNLTYGFVLQPKLPKAIGDLSFAVDYYKIEVDNEVAQVGTVNLLNLCYNAPAFRAGGSYCNYVGARAPGNNALTVLNGYVNIATQIVEGIDYNARYVRDIGQGVFRINAQVTQYLSQKNKTFKTDPFQENNGTLNTPEYVANAQATYTYKKWKARYGIDWTSSMDSYDLVFGPGTAPSSVPYIAATKAYYLQSMSLQYTSSQNWQVTGGVRNIANVEPPKISSGMGYNVIAGNSPLYAGYDFVGRTVFLSFSKKL